jgi:23S rRNA (uracil1939-C5)-methyltransferase
LTNSAAPERSLRPGSELDLLFTDLLANGQAVGRDGGMVVFCFGPLPSERARVRVITVKKSYAVAEMIALDASSAERVTPFCSVFGSCGGCQVQHLAYTAQLQWKRKMLANALERIGGIGGAPVREPVGMANPRAYRNKIALVVGRAGRDEKPELGFYRMRSHEVVPIRSCPVALPELDRFIAFFADAPAGSPARAALRGARHVIARYARATGQTAIAISTQHPITDGASLGPALRAQLAGTAGVVNSYEPRSENAVLGSRSRLLDGSAEIEEHIAGILYRVSTASFFQVNPEMIARIFETIEQTLLPAREIVDLYCGMGTFSLFFGKHGARVTGVEENVHAVREAQENARLNRLDELTVFRASRVEEFATSETGRRALAGAELVFLDPPRKGSDERTLRAIAAAGVRRIGYLSCDPATLARDLKTLAANGYTLAGVQPFDMFPQTGHVEALALLTKAKTDVD